jgi:hypothetical protein
MIRTHDRAGGRLRRYCHTIFIFGLLLLGTVAARAQQSMDYAIHANIIYHFTKYVNWPDDRKSGDFVIGIVGESPLYEKLRKFIANKTVCGQRIVIRKYSASAQNFDCHILFIGDDERHSLKKIAELTAGSSILIVTETPGLAHRGSCINFVLVDEHLKLEINKHNIEQRRLGVATELLHLARIVN